MYICAYNVDMPPNRSTNRPRRLAPAGARGKTRITIRIDDDVLAWFRRQVRPTRGSYQTAIDLALRDYIAREPLEATLRRVVREELARAGGRTSPHAYGYEDSRPALVADDTSAEYGASLKRRPALQQPLRHGKKK
jgi:uncharacterized protein (DUF4415 family)